MAATDRPKLIASALTPARRAALRELRRNLTPIPAYPKRAI